jgi:hypothetical protein
MRNPNPDELVEVFENVDVSLVWIARDELASIGVEGFIFGENLSHTTSRVASLFRVRLMVDTDEVDKARQCPRDLGFEK